MKAGKQKRERLKVSGQSRDDYISLSLTKKDDFSQGRHPESQLMRKDDELSDGADGALPCLVPIQASISTIYGNFSILTSLEFASSYRTQALY